MKTKIYALLALIVTTTWLSSCEKKLMDYEGKDCLYFDVRRGQPWIEESKWAHYNFSEVAFGNITATDTLLTLKVKVTGRLKDYDRPFNIIVVTDSTSAEANTEYEPLMPQYTIKAGETSTEVKIKIKKNVFFRRFFLMKAGIRVMKWKCLFIRIITNYKRP